LRGILFKSKPVLHKKNPASAGFNSNYILVGGKKYAISRCYLKVDGTIYAPTNFIGEGETDWVDGKPEEPEPEPGFHGRCLCRPAFSA
jgi:hypothetical protein